MMHEDTEVRRCRIPTAPEPCKQYGKDKGCSDCPGRRGKLTKRQMQQAVEYEMMLRMGAQFINTISRGTTRD